jgi:hypothetical protein
MAYERAARAGLLCIYTLAALFGLFLHSAGESQTARHVCAERQADIESDAGTGPSHDPTHCALCHLHEGLASALPPEQPSFEVPERVEASPAPRASRVSSALALVPRSRAPPRVLVANA